MPQTEIETLEQLEQRLAQDRRLRAAFVQSLDLTRTDLTRSDPQGAVFLGCTLAPEQEAWLREHGALVFPSLPDVPVNSYRSSLYTAAELYDTLPEGRYADSYDGRVYAWHQAAGTPPGMDYTLATALHDHAVADAQAELLAGIEPRRVVGIMGGHAAERGSAAYRATAELARMLARSGHVVASGGGPGAMEAANLGARLAPAPDAALDGAIARLSAVPSFRPSIDAWARVALEVAAQHPAEQPNLAIPTWFYGHEPPNVFASHVAKYFSNAIREDTLLASCRGGLVYLPGAAGTVQEVFQAATAGYYAQDPTSITPLVLVGVEQWTQTLPVWPLLSALAQGRALAAHVHVVDDVAAAAEVLGVRA